MDFPGKKTGSASLPFLAHSYGLYSKYRECGRDRFTEVRCSIVLQAHYQTSISLK